MVQDDFTTGLLREENLGGGQLRLRSTGMLKDLDDNPAFSVRLEVKGRFTGPSSREFKVEQWKELPAQ